MVNSRHGYHTIISYPGATVFPLIGLIKRCHIPFMRNSENLCVSSCAPCDELMLYARFSPTNYFRLEPCIPKWITAPPLPCRMHWSGKGYIFLWLSAVIPVT